MCACTCVLECVLILFVGFIRCVDIHKISETVNKPINAKIHRICMENPQMGKPTSGGIEKSTINGVITNMISRGIVHNIMNITKSKVQENKTQPTL